MNDIFIHYGSDRYNPERVRSIENHLARNKPFGGFWVSPEDSKASWKDWCLRNDYCIPRLAVSCRVKFRENANIYVVDSFEDLKRLPTFASDKHFYIDYEKVFTGYDAIWLTVNGRDQCIYLISSLSLSSWDCESLLIANPDCIYQIK